MPHFYIKYIDGHIYGPYSETEIRSFRLSKYTLVLKSDTNIWKELYNFNLPPLNDEEKELFHGAKSPYERPFKKKNSFSHKSYKNAIVTVIMVIIVISVIVTTYYLLKHINGKRIKEQYRNDTIIVQSSEQSQIIVHEWQN